METSSSAAAATYGGVAKTLHWLTALLLLCGFSIAFYMVDLKVSPTKLQLFSYHKWIGVSVFTLVVLRALWRARHPPPPLPPMPAWEARAAEITHRLLYLMLLVVPISGWLMSSAKGFQTVWFGVLPLPDLLHKDKALGAALEDVHFALNMILLTLIGLHVAAALKHYFIDHDRVLQRMLPRAAAKEGAP
jgi:cytochrome b561